MAEPAAYLSAIAALVGTFVGGITSIATDGPEIKSPIGAGAKSVTASRRTTEAPPRRSSWRGRISERAGRPELTTVLLCLRRNASPFWVFFLRARSPVWRAIRRLFRLLKASSRLRSCGSGVRMPMRSKDRPVRSACSRTRTSAMKQSLGVGQSGCNWVLKRVPGHHLASVNRRHKRRIL